LEARIFGRSWLEALVLAILLGTAIRAVWTPNKAWFRGINFSGRTLLEVAVLLLGASISAQTIMAAGPALLGGIAAVVVTAMLISYAIGRRLGLTRRVAVLIASGNSICGNSAIAAVAPVIGADGEDVAASIAFTAILGVVVVLTLPALAMLSHLDALQYGVLAGLTVYAVPQVLAATAPLGTVAVQMGTLVKLVRVLMLGPVVLTLSLIARHWRDGSRGSPITTTAGYPPVHKLIPWYVIGFVALLMLRSTNLIPSVAFGPISIATGLLTVIAMAALGLGTDLRALAKAGSRATATVGASLLALGAISFGLIWLLGVA
jgi:uncharacterized integral membrane protein (TIGR00698 family)